MNRPTIRRGPIPRVAASAFLVASPGWREMSWNGRDSRGRLVADGVYFVRFESGRIRETRKLVRLK